MKRLLVLRSLYFVLFCLPYFSCLNKVKDTDYSLLVDSLAMKTSNIGKQTDSFYFELQNKLQNVETSANAEYWLPRAMYAQSAAHAAYVRLSNYDSILSIDENAVNISSLQSTFLLYKHDILPIDPEIHEEIRADIGVMTNYYDSLLNIAISDAKKGYANKPKIEKLYQLEQMVYSIKTIENSIAKFCNSRARATK